MRRLSTVCACLTFLSALAFAETFTGKLVDAGCAMQQKGAACAPTATTSSFALQTADKVLKFDAEGNKKAADAYKASSSGADRSKDPNKPATQVSATVNGTLAGDEIKVESIEVR